MWKRRLAVVAIAALLIPTGMTGLWLWGQATSPAVAQSADAEYSPTQTITVIGQGSASLEPDIARVSVGVETSAETISDAVQDNEAKMQAIMDALEAAGIDAKDIQTTNFSIQLDRYSEALPRSTDTEAEPAPMYRVSNMVNVTIRDLEQVGAVLDSVIEAGANAIWGVSFGLDDPQEAEGMARVDAMADAGERAAALAELSGVELGPVMAVSEVVGGGSVPTPVRVEAAAAGGGVSVSPGEVDVNYQVQVTYFIER
ncbi:MAG: SIMPL domain-containing protein [Anaerolineae bacterium]